MQCRIFSIRAFVGSPGMTGLFLRITNRQSVAAETKKKDVLSLSSGRMGA